MKEKVEINIIGYVKDYEGNILPVFESERGLYAKIYDTVEKAKNSA